MSTRYTNGRTLEQFDVLPDSIKDKSIHKYTLEDEVELENNLLGLDVNDINAEMDVDEDVDENEDGDVDEEDEEDEDE